MFEVLMYGPIYDFSAQEFVQSFAENDSDSVVLRINTNGGNPEAGWSMLAKFSEFAGTKTVKVDGKAYSMGAFACLYADRVECLDVSQFMFHRAAYGTWYEQEYMNEAERTNLVNINKKLQEAFEARIDVAKFEALKSVKDKGITVKRLFSMDERVDCYLTADEAKKIGLVSSVVKITPQKAASINGRVASMAVKAASVEETNQLLVHVPVVEHPVQAPTPQKVINSKSNMTIAELQAQHPELYNQVVQAGVLQERDRVGAWMAFHEIDAKRVVEGVASNNTISQTNIAEFQVAAMKQGSLATLNAESQKVGGNGGADATVETVVEPVDKVAELTASIKNAK